MKHEILPEKRESAMTKQNSARLKAASLFSHYNSTCVSQVENYKHFLREKV